MGDPTHDKGMRKNLTHKAVQDPIHDEVMRKKPDTQGRSGYKGPSRLASASTPPFSAVLVCPAADSCVAC